MPTNQTIMEAIHAAPIAKQTESIHNLSTLDKLQFKGYSLTDYHKSSYLVVQLNSNLQKLFEETNQNNQNYFATVLWATTYINSPITLLAVDNLSYVDADLEAQYKILYTDKSTPRILDSTTPDDDPGNRFTKFGVCYSMENCIKNIQESKRAITSKIESILKSQGVKDVDWRSKVEAYVLAVDNHFSENSKRIFQFCTNHMLHMKSTNGLVESAVLFMVNRHRQLHVYGHPTTFTPTTPTIPPDIAREIRELLPNDIDEITIDVNGNMVANRPIPITPIPVTFTTQGEVLYDIRRITIDDEDETDEEEQRITFGDEDETDEEDAIDNEAEQLINMLEEVIDPPTNEGEVVQDTDIEVIDLTQLPDTVPTEPTPTWVPPAVTIPPIPDIPYLRDLPIIHGGYVNDILENNRERRL